jgi:putative transposase
MEQKLYKNIHYNTPGHAHELTFSVYHGFNLFLNEDACEMFLAELSIVREEFKFHLWAYVVMPDHVHVLLWPLNASYDIAAILKSLKGRVAKRYFAYHKENGTIDSLKRHRVMEKGVAQYRFWQQGGGFDRNLWNAMAIHKAIAYIEANPVRKKLTANATEYRWSSACARFKCEGLIPDTFSVPVQMVNL